MAQKIDHQGTVARPVFMEGPGLHSGGSHRVAIEPAKAGHGIVFRTVDRRGRSAMIPAKWQNVRDMPLCTCLTAENGMRVRTVEHLMAALYACGIDNATVEVHGPEIPILDGSAEPWVSAIQNAGILQQEKPRRRIVVRKKIELAERHGRAIIEPFKFLHLNLRTFTKGYGKMVWKGRMDRELFRKDMAAARTFGRLGQGLAARLLTAAMPHPLCQGAGLKTAVVISQSRILNPEGLRFPDEFVRHRVLDFMGDLMLGGSDVVGKITVKSPTHRLNRKILHAIFSDPEAWEEDKA